MIRNESKKMGFKSEILGVGFCGLLEFIMKQIKYVYAYCVFQCVCEALGGSWMLDDGLKGVVLVKKFLFFTKLYIFIFYVF